MRLGKAPLSRWKGVINIAKGLFLCKKGYKRKFFGSYYWENKKARGEALNPWAALCAAPTSRGWVTIYDIARTYFIKNS